MSVRNRWFWLSTCENCWLATLHHVSTLSASSSWQMAHGTLSAHFLIMKMFFSCSRLCAAAKNLLLKLSRRKFLSSVMFHQNRWVIRAKRVCSITRSQFNETFTSYLTQRYTQFGHWQSLFQLNPLLDNTYIVILTTYTILMETPTNQSTT